MLALRDCNAYVGPETGGPSATVEKTRQPSPTLWARPDPCPILRPTPDGRPDIQDADTQTRPRRLAGTAAPMRYPACSKGYASIKTTLIFHNTRPRRDFPFHTAGNSPTEGQPAPSVSTTALLTVSNGDVEPRWCAAMRAIVCTGMPRSWDRLGRRRSCDPDRCPKNG